MPAVQPAPAEPAMQRRHSSASSDAGSEHSLPLSNSRHTSQENVSLIPTRTAKVSTSKPPANPLQFVKVGPCDLSRYAQEQLKKAEQVKKAKPEKQDEAVDWQSNLDNWKVSRRKRQEHIIERVVEVKKLELEEHDRNRRRSKTFSEMLEDRNMKGRKTSLPVYQDDDNDLSDLGLSLAHKSNGEDCVFHEEKEGTPSSNDVPNTSSSVVNGQNGHSHREPSSEQEEYTYERAIQNYVNFTESRNRGRSLTPSDSDNSKLTNGFSKKSSPPVPAKPRRGSCKIEEKLSEFEQKKKSMSTNDLTENTKRPLSVPKIDILKRREMFEKSQDGESNKVKNRLSGDFSSSKSIRDRVSSLGKLSEDQTTKKMNRMSGEISVKDRLQNIEKQNSFDNSTTKSNISLNESTPPATTNSVKDRLSSLKKNTSLETKETNNPTRVTEEKVKTEEKSLKATGSDEKRFDKEAAKSTIDNNTDLDLDNHGKQPEPDDATLKQDIHIEEGIRESSTVSPTEDLYESKRQQHYRHRSLDSLDVDSTDGVGNDSFERVQSLEDLDFCRNYPASSVSGDTDREDSGIHTADVSSSVSQADDCDLHLDGEFQQQPTILEEINKKTELTSCFIVKQMNQMNVSDLLIELPNEVVPGMEVEENSSSFLKLPLRIDCDPLPVILESPSEPFPTTPDLLKTGPSQGISDSSLIPTQSIQSESNSDKSETVVNNDFKTQTELCNTKLTAFGDDHFLSNSLNVEQSLSTMPVQISSAEILHDNNLGVVEIRQMIDLSGVTTPLPNHTPSVSVQAEYKFEPTEGTTQKTYLVVKVKISNLKSPMEPFKNSFRD